MTELNFDTPTNGAAPDVDPIREAMRKANFAGGGRDKYLPKGKGKYEIDRLVWGPSPKNGQMRMVFVLKCLAHPDATNVGKVFEHKIKHASNRPLNMTLEEFGKWLVFPFGAGAKAALTAGGLDDFLVKAYKEQYATIITSQALGEGKPFKGKCIMVEVYDRTVTKPDAAGVPQTKTYTNTAIDIAA